jgi:hypothetical protein
VQVAHARAAGRVAGAGQRLHPPGDQPPVQVDVLDELAAQAVDRVAERVVAEALDALGGRGLEAVGLRSRSARPTCFSPESQSNPFNVA